MTENIKIIFETNSKLLGEIDKAVYYFREQQYEKALCYVANSIDQVKTVIEAIITDHEYFNLVTTESIMEMLSGILAAKKNKDFILLADLLELQLINFLIGVQELIISKEEIIFNEENYKQNIKLLEEHGIGFSELMLETINTKELLDSGYRIEFTSCGQMTLAAENDGTAFYFHTNNKIQSEAFMLARVWHKDNIKRYILYGFGMGYHVNELMNLAGEAEIEVYEADRNVIQLACAFCKLGNILENERIKLIYDPDLNLLKEKINCLKQDETFIVHYPSYKNIRNEEGKQIINSRLSCAKAIEAC